MCRDVARSVDSIRSRSTSACALVRPPVCWYSCLFSIISKCSHRMCAASPLGGLGSSPLRSLCCSICACFSSSRRRVSAHARRAGDLILACSTYCLISLAWPRFKSCMLASKASQSLPRHRPSASSTFSFAMAAFSRMANSHRLFCAASLQRGRWHWSSSLRWQQ